MTKGLYKPHQRTVQYAYENMPSAIIHLWNADQNCKERLLYIYAYKV